MLSDHDFICACLDADGCCRPATGSSANPLPPPRELINVVQHLDAMGITVAVVSGQPNCNIHVMETQMGIKPRLVLPDYGAYALVRQPDGSMQKIVLVSDAELAAMAHIKPAMVELLAKFEGYPDCRKSLIDTSFFRDAAKFFAAQSAVEELWRKFPDAMQHLLRQWHRTDNSINIVPQSVHKGGALQRLGLDVRVAAGDSSTDLTMLELAEFPIVTYDEGSEPNPTLVEVVKRKGRGYIAERPHGYGLADGLRVAEAAGVFTRTNLIQFPARETA